MRALAGRVRQLHGRTTDLPRWRRVALVTSWCARDVQDAVVERWRARCRGVRTAGLPPGQALVGESTSYVATPWWLIGRMLRAARPNDSDVLLEYGAGRGRVVLWAASHLAVRSIIGIDRDGDLIAAARANVQRWSTKFGSTTVELVAADAADYEVPEQVSIVYLFNPFVGTAFDRVLVRLQESLQRSPRELRVVYYYPLMHDRLVNAKFEPVVVTRDRLHAWAVYEYRPS